MNLFVADPHWGWWIVFYFFLGGIAAGAHFMATLIALVGVEEDWPLSRIGYRVAFPLVSVCGILLILDLDRPERFWHMLFKSETVHEAMRQGVALGGRLLGTMVQAPLLKTWSPMSIGSWALLVFGACTFLSFLGSLWPERRVGRVLLKGYLARALQVLGCLVGFFVAAYTGVLLTATNQPLWSDSVWIAPLFLTSAGSTGIAVMILLARRRPGIPAGTLDRLERADVWALGLELVLFVIFLASLGAILTPVLLTWNGRLLVFGTLVVGLVLPLVVHLRMAAGRRNGAVAASVLVLVGGFLLRYALLKTPPELLARGPSTSTAFSPEDGRSRGGGPGADAGNQPADFQPRSKVFKGAEQ